MVEESQLSTLVIVESPTKARTIAKFLPDGYVVLASNGHVRDLPSTAKDVPEKIKKEPWADLGVNVNEDFQPYYIVPRDKQNIVKDLRKAVKQASRIYLATDEDREGESISWHLQQLLKPSVPFQRLVFHEITKSAIQLSLESPRDINQDLVLAQETRRIVDRLYGYKVSPLLWKKLLPGLSAGRVQSVAVRLLVERERTRSRFTAASYWGMKASFAKDSQKFEADLLALDGKRVATSKDFDPETGSLKKLSGKGPSEVFILEKATASKLKETLNDTPAKVFLVEEKPFTSSPQAPYVTSTLQQEANSKLRFAAKRTMTLAQQLYENGFITYMRTDSTVLSNEAKTAARTLIEKKFGKEYLSQSVRFYRNKVKNTQEAHEAIRPAGGQFQAVQQVRSRLGPDAARLYEMIWRRTLASQMKDAKGTNSVVMIEVGDARFRAAGKTYEFSGYLKAYTADPDSDSELSQNKEVVLPKMEAGNELQVVSMETTERCTQPQQRFTEGSLIRELEKLGIGRPSTWATIVDIVQSRDYANKNNGALVPTFLAMAVVGLLEKHFAHLADYAFTAQLEDQLDAIARGELQRQAYLKDFYFGNGHIGLESLVSIGEAEIIPRAVRGIPLGKTEEGTEVEVCVGRYGPYVSDGTIRRSVPDTMAPDELNLQTASEMLAEAKQGPQSLGSDPVTNLDVYLKHGPYGHFVQLGGDEQEGKPKRGSLLRGMSPHTIDLQSALKLLSLPRSLGDHTDDQKEVIATNGRFGPFVKWGNEIRSIPAEIDLLEITLEQAVELLRQEKRSRASAAQSTPLKEIGKHPKSDKLLKIMKGRYGPFVTDGEINASLPSGVEPDDVTLDRAVELLKARAARIAAGSGKPRRRSKKS